MAMDATVYGVIIACHECLKREMHGDNYRSPSWPTFGLFRVTRERVSDEDSRWNGVLWMCLHFTRGWFSRFVARKGIL